MSNPVYFNLNLGVRRTQAHNSGEIMFGNVIPDGGQTMLITMSLGGIDSIVGDE